MHLSLESIIRTTNIVVSLASCFKTLRVPLMVITKLQKTISLSLPLFGLEIEATHPVIFVLPQQPSLFSKNMMHPINLL